MTEDATIQRLHDEAEARDLVSRLIADSRNHGHHVNLNPHDWLDCIEATQRLLTQIRTPSKKRRWRRR